jgi:hypothetical protein
MKDGAGDRTSASATAAEAANAVVCRRRARHARQGR